MVVDFTGKEVSGNNVNTCGRQIKAGGGRALGHGTFGSRGAGFKAPLLSFYLFGKETIMIYCCEEHVEYGLEEAVNEKGVAPILQQLEREQLSTNPCEYCGKPAAYIVSN